jgi:hypothetical protein
MVEAKEEKQFADPESRLAREQDLANAVSSLSLGNKSRQAPTLLYIDVLNYATDFFPLSDWNVKRAFTRVKQFVDSSARSGYRLTAFLDDTNISAEAMTKWRHRREDEVKKGRKNVPHGMNSMLGEMFRKCGVEVLYSSEADNDDTIAAYAHEHGAGILSRDKDVFRYIGANFPVYSEYSILSNGILSLTPHPNAASGSFTHPRPRPLLYPLPRTHPAIRHIKDGTYLRGAPSPCVRAVGRNPHAVVAPLRHAAYARLGLSGPIREEWPEWDPAASQVVWHAAAAAGPPADPAMLALLDRPDAAATTLFPDECGRPASAGSGGGGSGDGPRGGVPAREWKKHRFCVRSCVYEACAMAGGPSLLDLWLRYEAAGPTHRPGTARKQPGGGRGSAARGAFAR